MTGRQQWRGGKPQPEPQRKPGFRPADLEQAEAVVEDLPGERVRPIAGGGGGGFRIGATGLIAIVVLGGLLAAGFGLLGDRPEPSPSPSAPGRTVPPIVAEPKVTPSVPCGPEVDPEALTVLLEMDGMPTPGVVELISAEQTIVPVLTIPPGSGDVLVDIEADKHLEIWIANGVCALAWDLYLDQERLEQVLNPHRDPAYAAQNRFALDIAKYRPREAELRAVLYFSDTTASVRWRVNLLPFERPPARLVLLGDDDSTALIEGCDVSLMLGNGINEGADCGTSLRFAPEEALEAEPGSRLRIAFEGWTPFTTVVSCGRLFGLDFQEVPDPNCPFSTEDDPEVIRAPRPGEWTLAISTCASQDGSNATNRVCGTWYANLEVRF